MFPRTALAILGVLIVIIAAIVWWGGPFHLWTVQMAAGKAYMDSLTEKDIKIWTERTKTLLSEQKPAHGIGAYGVGEKPIPPELAKLKVVRIDVYEDRVDYVWMGGMDHTYLAVERMSDGDFRFTAYYNDGAKSRVIWPKK